MLVAEFARIRGLSKHSSEFWRIRLRMLRDGSALARRQGIFFHVH